MRTHRTGQNFKTIRKDMPNKQKNLEHTIQAALNVARRAQESSEKTNDPETKEADLSLAKSMLEEAARNQARLDDLIAYKQQHGYPT